LDHVVEELVPDLGDAGEGEYPHVRGHLDGLLDAALLHMGLIRPAGGDQQRLPVFQEADGPFLAKGIGKAQRKNPVDPTLHHGRHGGPPEWIDEGQALGPGHPCLLGLDVCRDFSALQGGQIPADSRGLNPRA